MKKFWMTILKIIKTSFSILKDLIIYGAIIFILVFIGYLYFENSSKEQLLELVTQYVGSVVTVLLGLLGIIEFAYDNGLHFLVPNSFENYKEKKQILHTKRYLDEYFNREAEYFEQHSNSRVTYLLNQLGLSRDEFDRLKTEMIAIKMLPLHNLDDAREKLKRIMKTGSIILFQDNMQSDELVYKEVKYFINFTDVMFVNDYARQITDCLVCLINETYRKQGRQLSFNRVAVSNKGNFLLGTGVSQQMNIAMVKIMDSPPIRKSKSWIGDFSTCKENETIIVHDVMVSGKQLADSLNKIKAHTRVTDIFCLVNRLEPNKLKEFEAENKVKVHYLLQLSDDDVECLLR